MGGKGDDESNGRLALRWSVREDFVMEVIIYLMLFSHELIHWASDL